MEVTIATLRLAYATIARILYYSHGPARQCFGRFARIHRAPLFFALLGALLFLVSGGDRAGGLSAEAQFLHDDGGGIKVNLLVD